MIDYSAGRLAILEKFGVRHYYGDATRPDLLHAAGIQNASVLVAAIDEREQLNQLVHYVCENHKNVRVIARAVDRDHVYELWQLGCRDIIRETYDSTLRMGRTAFEALGIETPTAQKMVDAFNAADRAAMIEVADVFQIGVPVHENEAYVKRVRDRLEDWERSLQAEIDEIRKEASSG